MHNMNWTLHAPCHFANCHRPLHYSINRCWGSNFGSYPEFHANAAACNSSTFRHCVNRTHTHEIYSCPSIVHSVAPKRNMIICKIGFWAARKIKTLRLVRGRGERKAKRKKTSKMVSWNKFSVRWSGKERLPSTTPDQIVPIRYDICRNIERKRKKCRKKAGTRGNAFP